MTNFESRRDTFTALVPELTRMTSAAFRDRDPEARAEAIQNTLALAWYAFHALIEQGRGDEPNIIKSVVWFSVKQTRVGRTIPSGGEAKPKDVFTHASRGRFKVERIDLREFVDDATAVPEQVSFRLDVPAFLSTLNERQQRMAEALAIGETTSAVAAEFGVTPGAVSQFRLRFKTMFDTFMAG